MTRNDSIPNPLAEVSLTPLASPVLTYLANGRREDCWDLSAPYQRGSVWSEEQRRALIKSLLMRLPVGAVTYAKLSVTVERFYRVIDGKQRIEAVRAFVDDEFTTPGWWFGADDLQDPTRRDGEVRFSDLSRGGRSRVELAPMPGLEFDSAFRSIRTDKGWGRVARTPEEQLEAVFGLINSGGTPQTPDDLARAAALTGEGA